MTLECERCDHTLSNVKFSLSESNGETDSLTAYWTKSELINVEQEPTCQDGWGTYRATIYYKGQRLSGTYRNFIPAYGDKHEYGTDGICHKPHYKTEKDSVTGGILKDSYGYVMYQYADGGARIPDDSVYRSNGYVAIPVERAYVEYDSITPINVTDPETGEVMTYQDYMMVQYPDADSLTRDLLHQTSPYYLGTFGDYCVSNTFVQAKDDMLGIDYHGGGPVYKLTDLRTYDLSEQMTLDRIDYIRSFGDTAWQPLYVPFALSVEMLQDKGVQVAGYRDAYVRDLDLDGKADSVVVEFELMESGAMEPNRPYMVRATQAAAMSLSLEDAVIAQAQDCSVETVAADETVSVVGTYQGLERGAMYQNGYFGYTSDMRLTRATSTANVVRPQRWYVKVENTEGAPVELADSYVALARVLGWQTEELSGIDNIPADVAEGEHRIYTLDGMRVNGSGQLKRGIYVVNGKLKTK